MKHTKMTDRMGDQELGNTAINSTEIALVDRQNERNISKVEVMNSASELEGGDKENIKALEAELSRGMSRQQYTDAHKLVKKITRVDEKLRSRYLIFKDIKLKVQSFKVA